MCTVLYRYFHPHLHCEALAGHAEMWGKADIKNWVIKSYSAEMGIALPARLDILRFQRSIWPNIACRSAANSEKHKTMHFRIAAAILTFWCFCGCDEGKMILELKDVQNFQLIEKREASELKISGQAFHSALGVKKITTEIQGLDLIIKVHLVLADKKYSGNFSYTLAMPAGTARVLFGNERKEIWKRL